MNDNGPESASNAGPRGIVTPGASLFGLTSPGTGETFGGSNTNTQPPAAPVPQAVRPQAVRPTASQASGPGATATLGRPQAVGPDPRSAPTGEWIPSPTNAWPSAAFEGTRAWPSASAGTLPAETPLFDAGLPTGSPEHRPPVAADPGSIPPELVGHPRYEVYDILGAGGMGVVYRARHRLMARTVALKVMARHLFEDPQALGRFHREVKSAALLRHPNIVTAYDAEQAGDLHFLVTEYIDGRSLQQVVRQGGPLSIALAAGYALQTALGLQHAHELGMVHRDIKPQNLMLTTLGEVKILDFGLARVISPTAATLAGLTNAGAVIGTPDYIAPEQADNSRNVDTRTDLYSLGCTLYFMLTGRPPFPDGNAVNKVCAHLHKQPQLLTELRPEVPAGLAAVVSKLMEKSPDRRYATPAEAAEALRPFAEGRSASAPAAVPYGRLLGLVGAAAVGILLGILILNLTGSQEAPPSPTETANTLPAAGETANALPAAGDRRQPTSLPGPANTAVSRANPGSANPANRTPAGPAGTNVGGRFPVPPVPAAIRERLAEGVRNRLAPPENGSSADPRQSGPSDDPRQDSGLKVPLPAPAAAALIVPTQGLWYRDYAPIEKRLREGGFRVVTAGVRVGPARFSTTPSAASGPAPIPSIEIERELAAVDLRDFAAVIFLGADVSEFVGDGPGAAETARILRDAWRGTRLIAAICRANKIPADHGFLKGLGAARAPFLGAEEVSADSANWRNEKFVLDGRLPSAILTAATDAEAEPLALKVLDHYRRHQTLPRPNLREKLRQE